MSTGVIFSARIERGHARHSERPPEDDSRQMICTPGETPYRSVVVGYEGNDGVKPFVKISHAEQWHQGAWLIVVSVLSTTFPCQGEYPPPHHVEIVALIIRKVFGPLAAGLRPGSSSK
jgi:hypothetical protein